jgi:hypothetical protein
MKHKWKFKHKDKDKETEKAEKVNCKSQNIIQWVLFNGIIDDGINWINLGIFIKSHFLNLVGFFDNVIIRL